MSRPGELVTREELTAHLWPTRVVDFDAGLNTAMRKLRVALGDDAETPKYIETVPRQGYRFIGIIEPSAAAAFDSRPRRGRPPRNRRQRGSGDGQSQGRHGSMALVACGAADPRARSHRGPRRRPARALLAAPLAPPPDPG